VDNPEYFHMPGANDSGGGGGGGGAFQPVRSSSPQYIGEYLHPRTLSCYDDDKLRAKGRCVCPTSISGMR